MELVWDGVAQDSAFLKSSQEVLIVFILGQCGIAKIYGKQSPNRVKGLGKTWLYYKHCGILKKTDVWAPCHMVQVSRS